MKTISEKRAYWRKIDSSPQRKAYKLKWKKEHGYKDEYASVKRHPKKQKARYKIRYAIRKGVLKRGLCEKCSHQKTEGHHDNYLKPLEVRWLCRPCHSAEHRK